MPPIGYSIEARAYDIVGIAAHNFWVLRDEGGQALGQLHGLATNPDHQILPIGKIGDKLKFYHFGHRAIEFGLEPGRDKNYIRADQQARLAFAGSPDEAMARWDNAVQALKFLNDLDLPYTPFAIFGRIHLNSNTAYSLLGRLMNIPIPKFSGYWQPGWRNANMILTSEQLETMRYPQAQSDIDAA